MRSFYDLVIESVTGFGLFRSYLVGASYPNLMAERVRQSYALGTRYQDALRRSDDDSPVLNRAVSLLSSYVSRLDSNVLIGRDLVEAYRQVSTKERREAFFGYPGELPTFPATCPIYRRAAQAGLRQRASELKFRIVEELARPGIFPVFNTLTTDPQYDYIFEPGSEVLKLWFRKVARVLGPFTYCSVLERGAEGKLHWHVLMCFSECRFLDPNRSRPLNDHQEVNELKRLWQFGFSTPIAVRYSPLDVYGKLGWRWPRDPKTRRPRRTGSPAQVSGYMAKYVTKVSPKELNGCRTRMTRGFGLRRLVQTRARAAETVMMLGAPTWLADVKWSEKPPKRLLLRLAFASLCEIPSLRPLPKMRLGSVSVASEMLRTRTFSLMSAGASGVPRDGSKWLNPYLSRVPRLSIGGQI